MLEYVSAGIVWYYINVFASVWAELSIVECSCAMVWCGRYIKYNIGMGWLDEYKRVWQQCRKIKCSIGG